MKWVALSAVLALAACNSGSSSATATSKPSIEATTTAAPTTTIGITTPKTTTTAAAATPTSTTQTTATPTTTAPDPDAAKRQAVVDAAVRSWAVFNEAKLDPTNDAKLAALAAAYTGELLTNAQTAIQDYRAANHRSVTHPELPSYIRPPDPASVILSNGGQAGTVEFCELNSNAIVELGSGDDGTVTVIDDDIVTNTLRIDFQLFDDDWLAATGVLLETRDGETSCAAG